MIGPRQGIAYTTDGAVTATHMTEFSHVQSIQTVETPSDKSGPYHKGKYLKLFLAAGCSPWQL